MYCRVAMNLLTKGARWYYLKFSGELIPASKLSLYLVVCHGSGYTYRNQNFALPHSFGQ